MAPIKPKTVKGKKPAASASKSSSKGKKPTTFAPKSKPSSKKSGPPPKSEQVKTKRSTLTNKKKRKVYTDKELDIPTLNMITPAGVQKPKGKKRGKVFVDDQESMMTILAMVNAEKEGQIESKIMKSRQMEEIREARRQEAEARQDHRKNKLEETKDAIRKGGRKRKGDTAVASEEEAPKKAATAGKKRVSFG